MKREINWPGGFISKTETDDKKMAPNEFREKIQPFGAKIYIRLGRVGLFFCLGEEGKKKVLTSA